jgi:hypothetical protein
VGSDHPDGIGHVAGLCHHMEAVGRVEQEPQAAADDGVVVGDHDRGRVTHI